MSEFDIAGVPSEKRRFDPEGNFYNIPLDPYNDRLVQFTALKQMGYPVDLVLVPVEDFPDGYFTRNEMEWERDNFPVWARPVVHVTGFEEFIEDPDVPGDCITSNDEELNRLLGNHPVQLVNLVDFGAVRSLANAIKSFNKYDLISLEDSGTGLLTRDLLISCYMVALERYVDWKARGYQHWQDEYRDMVVTTSDFIRHKTFELQGYRAASPEQLGALALDNYELAERAQPAILEYKV